MSSKQFLTRKSLSGLSMALLLAACGGGGGGGGDDGSANPANPDVPNPDLGAHTLTLSVSGLPTGASLPVSYSGGSVSLTADETSKPITGNGYTLVLGKVAAANPQPYLIQCAFGEPASGTTRNDDGTLRVALSADAAQAVQCQRKVFAALKRSPQQNGTPITGMEILVANADGSAAQWLPGQLTKETVNYDKVALLNNEIFFSGRDADYNSGIDFELYATDGTQTGNRLVKDINLTTSPEGSDPSDLIAGVDRVYFSAKPSGAAASNVPFITDGSEAGTRRLIDASGAEVGTTTDFVDLGDRVLLIADGKYAAIEKSAPGKAIDLALDDVLPGSRIAAIPGSRYAYIYNARNQRYWLSDGTKAGTHEIMGTGQLQESPVEFQGKFYYAASGGSGNLQLWRSDSAASAPALFKTINATGNARVSYLTVAGDKLFFIAVDGVDYIGRQQALWVTDGTDAGTRLVKHIVTGGTRTLSLAQMSAVGDRVVFLTKEGSSEDTPYWLWVSDGTEAGTQRLASASEQGMVLRTRNINPTKDWIRLNDERLLFMIHEKEPVSAETLKAGVWITDGTPEGTRRVKDQGGNQVEIVSEPKNYIGS